MEVSKQREREVLLKKMEQIRRLLVTTLDERMTAAMKEVLQELEEQLRQPELAPSEQRLKGTESTEREITRRAYELWEQAGHPQGRSDEFYSIAEQELRSEDKAGPLRKSDTV